MSEKRRSMSITIPPLYDIHNTNDLRNTDAATKALLITPDTPPKEENPKTILSKRISREIQRTSSAE
jgi:hypothetical protein